MKHAVRSILAPLRAQIKVPILDPVVLLYAGYIGGSAFDAGYGIAVDGAGNAYVTGETASTQATFPVAVGPDLTHNGGRDAFVAKVPDSGDNCPTVPNDQTDSDSDEWARSTSRRSLTQTDRGAQATIKNTHV